MPCLPRTDLPALLRSSLTTRLAAFTASLLLITMLGGCQPSPFQHSDISKAGYEGKLSLTDHHGQRRTLADFRGKVVALFFGYTQCPDVCPTSLATMSTVMSLLGEARDQVQVLFVSVDPERDTPELLAEYMPAFDAGFIGLYGNAEETARAAQAFRVIYQKSGDLQGHYTVDHSAGTFLIDPQGQLRLYVRYGASAESIAADIRALLAGH